MAVIGWGAALAAIAPSAGAAADQASSTTYNSQATGSVLDINLLGTSVNLFNVKADDSNSPQTSNFVSIDQVEGILNGIPTLGPAVANALKAALPNGANLVTEEATANSDGTSTGCAALLAGDCTTTPHTIKLNISLSDLSSLLSSTPVAGLLGSLPGLPTTATLANTDIVVTLNGPTASCSAGPVGSGQVSAAADSLDASLDIKVGNTSILPSGPVAISGNSIFDTVLGPKTPVGNLLQTLNKTLPIQLIVSSSSTSTNAAKGTASATALELGLDLNGKTVFDIKGATVTCGANTAAAVTPSSPSGEKPLGAITTDEGRSSVPAADSYLALNGMP